jgi:hypothetical protein
VKLQRDMTAPTRACAVRQRDRFGEFAFPA